ncbi:hypothetical protein OSTOST_01317 [Ostertagia ostertagi]
MLALQLNNHCVKGACGACAYGFRCDCEKDIQSGISCLHVHACLIYASSGRIAAQNQAENVECVESTAASLETSYNDEGHSFRTYILDSNNNFVHEIERNHRV